jgi:hypothetical protein
MSDQRAGLPIRLFDEDNLPYTANNPLPVTLEESEGNEIHDFKEDIDVLKAGGTASHIYTVSVGKAFVMNKMLGSASGRAKFELQVETALASALFVTKAVAFSTVSSSSIEINLNTTLKVAAGVKVKVIKTNLDNNDHNIYTTIIGTEK